VRDWSIVVPLKRLHAAKSRLRGAVPGVAHDDLVLALALDTVQAALRCPVVRAVYVVTDEIRTQNAVSALGAHWIRDAPDAGLNPALTHGAAHVARSAPDTGVATLGGDLPALRPEELAEALTMAMAHERAYVPDAPGSGTVLLTARPGVTLDPRFGPDSAREHARSGAYLLDGVWPSLRRDVDVREDLVTAAHLGLGSHTSALLATAAIHL